jgi:transposase
MRQAGLAVELLETRHVRNTLKTMPVKTDRNDARGIAQLMRLGWFRPVHCKSMAAQETRALLTARKLVQVKIGDASVRTVLYEAANIILIKPLKGCTALKSWAMKLARRTGMKKAKVALARKIAVVMHRMLVDGTSFRNVAAV